MSDDTNTPKPEPAKRGVGSRPIPPGRLEKVRDEYLRGALLLDRQRELANEWNISTRQVRNYLARVKRQLAKHEAKDVEAARARAEQMLLHTFDVAENRKGHTMAGTEYDDPDTKSMVAAAVALADVFGAKGPTKVEHTGKDGAPLIAPMIFIPQEDPK